MVSTSALWSEYEEKLKEAHARDRLGEAESFLPSRWTLAGHDVGALSIRKYLILEHIKSPFIDGGEGSLDDLKNLLWILSESFCEDPEKAKAYKDKLTFKRLSIEEFSLEAYDYVKWNFRIIGKEPKTDEKVESGLHWIVTAIDMIASQYGWAYKDIMEMPIRVAMVLSNAMLRRLAMQSGQKPIMFSPEADEVKAEFMRRANGNG